MTQRNDEISSQCHLRWLCNSSVTTALCVQAARINFPNHIVAQCISVEVTIDASILSMVN